MTALIPVGTIIATRALTFARHNGGVESVTVSIGAPIQDREDAWLCPYLIEAESFRKAFRMAGGDSMQALILTLTIISTELEYLAKKHDGVFQYFGDSELHFPTKT
jgi:hypothetical protein